MSNREVDINGYVTIKRNPISKVGVFPYLGKNIDAALEPNKIYFVYRPAEELCKPETIASFRNIPIIDDHTMLGVGATPAERKGIEGTTGAEVIQEGDYLYADLHIYSDTLKRKIDANKKDLSIGYRVSQWEKANGTFNGTPYDYIQRGIIANHVALVQEGRSGKDVSVMDELTYDHMDIVEDASELATLKTALTNLQTLKKSARSSAEIKEFDTDIAAVEKEIQTAELAVKAAKGVLEAARKRFNAAQLALTSDPASKKEFEAAKGALQVAKQNTASDSTAPPAADEKGGAECNKTKGANDMADEDKKKDEDKKAMDEDTKEKPGDDKLAKDKKAKDAKDAAEEDDKKKKAEDKKAMDKKAMDAEEEKKDKKDDKEAMDAAIAGLNEQIADLKKNGLKSLMAELNQRNEIAKTVEAQFGTFDHAELTANEVAAYGLKKAGIEAPKGAETAVWSAYNAGRKTNAGQVRQATDAKDIRAPEGSLIAKTLAASK